LIIKVIAVSKIKENYILKGIEEYTKRLKPYCKLKIKEVDAQKIKSSMPIEKIKDQEAEKISQYVSSETCLIALDEHGKQLNSLEFAETLKNITETTGKNEICFIIGGANGLSKGLLDKSDTVLALSKLTFPHQLARLILIEQLYRAFRIIKGEPYHK